MNDTIQIYVLFILISFSGGAIFIGVPESNWTTSAHVCSLPAIDKINTTDIFKISSEYMHLKDVEKAWTGTVIKYTKWAAFIGCGKILSSLDSRINVNTAEDCLRHCSELSSATYFAIKTSTCFCLTERPEIKGDINDCRTECTNATYTPCSSGGSAMVFILDKDVNIEESNTYIEHECLATTKQDKSKFAIWDCNTRKLYGCTNTSTEFARLSWYEYQEKCLQEGNFVVYNRNAIGKTAKDEPYWTPMFRSHTVVTGKLSGEELCLALTKEETKHFTAENCSCQFPFLCSGSQKKITIVDSSLNDKYPRLITLPTSVVVAFILLVIILIFSMVITSIKAFRRLVCKTKQKDVELLPSLY
ncbi:unnamed protein product [Mytilus edulis]|uniref:WSC domain-containing protein n=1 Tax=Mytilus edulis TaxID=6550 RepID=A0A8S3TE78_MYTED|nr:unnamed protein product [Mytilus edulis]